MRRAKQITQRSEGRLVEGLAASCNISIRTAHPICSDLLRQQSVANSERDSVSDRRGGKIPARVVEMKLHSS
jgi:hypothetical protein